MTARISPVPDPRHPQPDQSAICEHSLNPGGRIDGIQRVSKHHKDESPSVVSPS